MERCTQIREPAGAARFAGADCDLQRQGAKWVINTGRDLSSVMEGMARARLSIKPDFLVVVERTSTFTKAPGTRPARIGTTAADRRMKHCSRGTRGCSPAGGLVSKRFRAALYEDAFSPFCLIAENNEDADAIQQYLDEYCGGVPA